MAMAVLMRQASAPISMARAACEGAPMPASITTGTLLCSMMICSISSFLIPLLVPMGAANGITVTAPSSSNCLHATGSACTYGSTLKPSFTSSSVAFSVSRVSGSRYFGSGWISSFSHSVPRAARFILAAKTASSASRTPEVLGSSRHSFGMKSRTFSLPLSCVLSRLNAVVTISAPEATMARRITSLDGNLPVPMNRREPNSRPAIISLSFIFI